MARRVFRFRFGLLPVLVVTISLISGKVVPGSSSAATPPELPRLYIDTTFVPPSGRTIHVPAGGDFQAALNAAWPGDAITLEAGATFTGPFTLSGKQGSGWIVVRTSAPDSSLPPPGTRVNPSYAPVMPKIVVGPGLGGAIQTAPGAHHYRFIGIEVHPLPGAFVFSLIELGRDETSEEMLPHDIVFDRCYIHGDPTVGGRRGIALNARSVAVIDSYLADFKELVADSQAMAGWNGPGPFKIVNNYVEAAGENVMFGGADPPIPNLVPSDIEIRHNHFFKPLSWKIGDPSYGGTPWSVKNLFELKNARRVLIEGNLFEHNWMHVQSGFAILFTVRNQDGGAPWSVVEDVTFASNIVRRSVSGVNLHGRDFPNLSQKTRRIRIANNLFLEIEADPTGVGGRLFQLTGPLVTDADGGGADVVIEHNTGFQSAQILVTEGDPHAGFVFRDNIVPHNLFGIVGTGTMTGFETLARYFPDAVVAGNVLMGGPAALYPPGNFFPVSVAEVGFVDPAAGDFRLAETSPFKHMGTDDTDPGVDFDALAAAMVPVIPVTIDIKPGSDPNSINLGSGGTVPVAILSTQVFDAATVDSTSVTLAGARVRLKGKGTPMAALEDVNGDGVPDLVVHVLTEALTLSDTDTLAILEGQTVDGRRIRGTGAVRIVP
ncbi:MAG: hypothetical protein HYX77_00485 [Acidobacteria bacterium]|nr:hypothetical protein [Acidobacteriota bacterium]